MLKESIDIEGLIDTLRWFGSGNGTDTQPALT